ncbi:MAG TPA: DUF5916 domain-containing protein [Candidatus Polarisedimenticolaceae bacterium]|nr:DUF5916 domain-containing protein [Candidatus Polarisedimenticolaceae bacterium]
MLDVRIARAGSAFASLALVSAGAALPCVAETVFPIGRRDRPVVAVPRLDRAPTLDEFVEMRPPADLAEHLAHITGFLQRQPDDGRPASQRTDVYLGHDDEVLYVVFVAWDDDPRKIRAHLSRREQVFADETVEIQLDTFDDEQRAFSFLTNPFGIQWDAIWTEGQGFDESWDTVWQSKGVLTDRGYVVWMAIPFKSLRFRPRPEQEEHTWGVVLVRDIPRNNETSFWPQVTSTIEGRLNQAATARGFAGVAPGRNLWLIPYAAGAREDFTPQPDAPTSEFEERDVGLDAKWVVRDSLTLDATINPNFAQIESDDAQVTINRRFEVFFPERRPFFLENADYFRTPLDLLFTRRIVDPEYGARLTGQLGAYKLGAFVIDDEFPGRLAAAPAALAGERAINGIFRLRRDLPNQSNVGLLLTARELDRSYNRVGGVDSRVKLGSNWDTQLQAVFSSSRLQDFTEPTTPDAQLDDSAWSASFNRSGRKLNAHLHYLDIGPEFRTELGFIPRTDVRDAHAEVSYNFWSEDKALIRVQPLLFVQRIDNHDGVRLDESVSPVISWEFRRRTTVGLFGRAARERLLKCRDYFDPTCDSALPPPGSVVLPADLDFDVGEVGLSFDTAFVAAVELDLNYEIGRGINLRPVAETAPAPADVRELAAELTLRLGRRWRIVTEWLRSELDDRASGRRIFFNEILRSRFDWQLNPRLSLRAITRYDRTEVEPSLTAIRPENALNGDLLATYLVNPWTAFYVGYNTNRTQTGLDSDGNPVLLDERFTNSNLAFVKVSYLFRP